MTLFAEKAVPIMDTLISYGWKDFQAAAVCGSFGRETGGFQFLRELGQPPGRGGYGWAMWTGPRRVDFLNYCHDHDLDWTSDEANMGFFAAEIGQGGPYRFLPGLMKKTIDLHDAVTGFEHYYEGAGVVAMHDRYQWAIKALNAYHAARKEKIT